MKKKEGRRREGGGWPFRPYPRSFGLTRAETVGPGRQPPTRPCRSARAQPTGGFGPASAETGGFGPAPAETLGFGRATADGDLFFKKIKIRRY